MTTPAFLSTPLANGFSIAKADPSSSFETDAARTRRRSTFRSQYAPEVLSLAWNLTPAEFDDFVEFYEDELAAGSKPFPLQINGIETAPKSAMFTGAYEAEYDANINGYRVRASVVRVGFIRGLNDRLLYEIPNDPPVVATGYAGSTSYRLPLSIPIEDLIATGSDPNAGDTLSLASVGSTVNGTVEIVDGSVVFTPTGNTLSPASFSYTLQDSKGATVNATASITLTNTTPAGSFSASIPYNEEYVLPIASLLAGVTDADGDTPAFVSATPVSGIFDIVVSPGSENLVIRPTWDFVGVATFDFVVADAWGSSTLTATLTVNYVNDTSLRLRMGWGATYTAPDSSTVTLSMNNNLGPYVAPPGA